MSRRQKRAKCPTATVTKTIGEMCLHCRYRCKPRPTGGPPPWSRGTRNRPRFKPYFKSVLPG
uniref:Uncharacterized protein n=1 Tax=Anopheles arabiensis TaxID=7173 RepID=A0A182IFN1_ANOAR